MTPLVQVVLQWPQWWVVDCLSFSSTFGAAAEAIGGAGAVAGCTGSGSTAFSASTSSIHSVLLGARRSGGGNGLGSGRGRGVASFEQGVVEWMFGKEGSEERRPGAIEEAAECYGVPRQGEAGLCMHKATLWPPFRV